MNYEKIYKQFIADRRNKEPEAFFNRSYRGRVGYAQRNNLSKIYHQHHIIPVAEGGSDNAKNIIALTHDDHFFAHLCLAHIYPAQWAAVRLMAVVKVDRKTKKNLFSQRRIVGIAFRKYAKISSDRQIGIPRPDFAGKNNPRFDRRVHLFENIKTGEIKEALQSEMKSEFGGATWTMLVSKSIKQTMGWKLAGEEVDICPKGKVFTVRNSTGKTFTGTQSELGKLTGVGSGNIYNICRGTSATGGWLCDGVEFIGKRIGNTLIEAERVSNIKEHEKNISLLVKSEIKALNRIFNNIKSDEKKSKRKLTFSRFKFAVTSYKTINQIKVNDKATYELLRIKGLLNLVEKRLGRVDSKKKVLCLDTGDIFDSVESAAKWAGLTNQTPVGMVCKGKRPRAGGYRWAYA
jgi:hypothetical protein